MGRVAFVRTSAEAGVAKPAELAAATWAGRWLAMARAYVELAKPGIALLLLFTEYAAMMVAQQGVPAWRVTWPALAGLGLAAGGAAAINMWYDRDIDGLMRRTARRPLPAGLVKPWQALSYGLVLVVLGILILWGWSNPLAALLTLAGTAYYAVIYTMGLKRRTPQNIVIGGGAGAFPPLVGWAAVTGHLSLAAWMMFLIIFLWTPAHFWALALYKNEDYVRAGVPMMPVVRGARATKRQMVAYNALLLAVSLVPALTERLSWLYCGGALVLGAWFLLGSVRLLREPDDQFTWARRTFFASLMYLPLVFIWLAGCAVF
ncbi:MAG: protoheme IX farnesyltransferase [Alicyclobacillaceae bacterium]|nr:protoheme IX farnesyltransferase [Alicyclobacillaceae bacterium]